MSNVQEGPVERWPTLGQHTDSVLQADLGIDDAEIARLRAAGAIGGGDAN